MNNTQATNKSHSKPAQAKAPDQVLSPDLSHRLNYSMSDNAPDASAYSLQLAVDQIALRASCVLDVIQSLFTGESEMTLNHDVIFFSLDSVKHDIEDTRRTVQAFYAASIARNEI